MMQVLNEGRHIDRYIPRDLRGMFYRNLDSRNKYRVVDGYDPYGFSTNGLVLYLPLWALKDSAFKSVDAYKHTCTRTASGILHFDGSANSSVDFGAIHNASAKLWVSFWFKLDAAFSSASSNHMTLWAKYLNDANYMEIYLDSSTGSLKVYLKTADGERFHIASSETSWVADTWYHVISSISDVAAVRLRINGGTAVTDADASAAPNGGNVLLGTYTVDTQGYFAGEMKEVVCGVADINAAAELALYETETLPTHTEYWPMDEGSGATINDQEGTADADGTADSACTWENVPMHWRPNGHYFDGFDDLIECGKHDVLVKHGAAVTLLAWVNSNTDGTQQAIIAMNNGGGVGYFELRRNATRAINFAFYEVGTTYPEIIGIGTLTLNTWNLVGVTYDETNMILYIDGVLDKSQAENLSMTDEPTNGLRVGGRDAGTWNGLIGEAWKYNRALSVEEILHLYNATAWRYQ